MVVQTNSHTSQSEVATDEDKTDLKKILASGRYSHLPKVGDIVKAKVIYASKSEVRLDIDGITTGVVRGREFYDESNEYTNLRIGDEVEATVIEQENENGEMELSFRYAGHQKAWNRLEELLREQKIITTEIHDANRGGLMTKVGKIVGFLPVSQLSPEFYPRVPGGDKVKILEILKSYIGKKFEVKVIDVDEKENKLIVSEKAAWEEKHRETIDKYKVGDAIVGKITAVTDFGAFVEFGEHLEGLIHISELAWQRIDNPSDIVKVGDNIEAEIIGIEKSKIFLSAKKLKKDPWENIEKKYAIGQKVKGKILKVNPFGLFVELDRDIHGLAHISELSDRPIANIEDIAKAGDTKEFEILSIEPKEHRLGLRLGSKTSRQPTSNMETASDLKTATDLEKKIISAETDTAIADNTKKADNLKDSKNPE